jgi:hypothetical protein
VLHFRVYTFFKCVTCEFFIGLDVHFRYKLSVAAMADFADFTLHVSEIILSCILLDIYSIEKCLK